MTDVAATTTDDADSMPSYGEKYAGLAAGIAKAAGAFLEHHEQTVARNARDLSPADYAKAKAELNSRELALRRKASDKADLAKINSRHKAGQ